MFKFNFHFKWHFIRSISWCLESLLFETFHRWVCMMGDTGNRKRKVDVFLRKLIVHIQWASWILAKQPQPEKYSSVYSLCRSLKLLKVRFDLLNPVDRRYWHYSLSSRTLLFGMCRCVNLFKRYYCYFVFAN